MSTSHGICLISVPKSGTMFLSRYLEKLADAPVIFGLNGLGAHSLRRELEVGWHADIRSRRAESSPNIDVMTRRFALMLARNRSAAQHGGRPPIFSDHGLSSFLRFLINPRNEEIQHPREISEWAGARNVATVFLHRDIRAVSNSLAHFLASSKSFLIGIDTLESAADLVVRLYAPVLAEQMRLWQKNAAAHDVLCVSYEDLMANPTHWIEAICQRGGLPYESRGVADAPDSYRSWTYRTNRQDGWSSSFSADQQAALNALAVQA
ncbi:sulfotransferase [Sulfuritalea sp.]|uniref:sulfotransferase n=1 Tax=Sulfuritalea sp. TaxID=2480090 RepID=UPI00286E2A53|nr:sulfotransferase [Sulfuritalea sp.]